MSLHHIVFTWDGFATNVYVDAKFQGKLFLPWGSNAWKAEGAALILGNNARHVEPFIGTYYLVAIHDRCFSSEDIRHNFLAGPSALS
jgi:hypothetical protein